MDYTESDYLMLSGLQHFSFCRRQWALIHIERQWAENYRTTDGQLFHEKAHNADFRESRGDCIITRGIKVHSSVLGLSGTCDVLEFHWGDTGIPLKEKEGLWQPYPIEYKRGKPDSSHTAADELQLCAQAMCLEEMLCCDIPAGALYYGQTRHRQKVDLTSELRQQVKTLTGEMHTFYQRGTTPKVKPTKACNACSLKELCLPKLIRTQSAAAYIRAHWEELE